MFREPNFIKDAHSVFTEPLEQLHEKFKYIIIHHSQEQGWDVFKTHCVHQTNLKWSGIGYNFFIEEN